MKLSHLPPCRCSLEFIPHVADSQTLLEVPRYIALLDINNNASGALLTCTVGGTYTASDNTPADSFERFAQVFLFGPVTGTVSNLNYGSGAFSFALHSTEYTGAS